MFQNLRAVAVAAFPAVVADELSSPNNFTERMASKIVRAAITTVVTFAERRMPT